VADIYFFFLIRCFILIEHLAKSKKVVLKSRGMDRECHNQLISTYNQELKKKHIKFNICYWKVISMAGSQSDKYKGS
jgi:hypothetical protein